MDLSRYNSSATLVTLSPGNTTKDVMVLVEGEVHVEFISREFVDGFADMLVVLMPVLCVLAMLFCVLNALVYWQQRGATFALYLIAVDLGDGFCSLLQLMYVITGFTLPADSYSHLLVKWYISKYVGVSFRRAAVCLNALASLERFLAIAFPLKSVTRRVCGKVVIIIIATFAISLSAHTYLILEYKVVANGRGGWMLSHTDVRKANPDAFALWSLTDVIIFAYFPLVAIMVLNSTLLIVLKRHTKSLKSVRRVRGTGRSSLSQADSALSKTDSALSDQDDDSGLVTVTTGVNDNKPAGKDKAERDKVADIKKREEKTRENQTTKMVMVFSTVFLTMALPRMLNSSASNLIADYGPQGKERNLYNSIGLLSGITSHLTETALFFVSFCYSRSFRRAVFRLPFARWLCRRWLAKTALPAAGTSFVDVSGATGRRGLSRSGSVSRFNGQMNDLKRSITANS